MFSNRDLMHTGGITLLINVCERTQTYPHAIDAQLNRGEAQQLPTTRVNDGESRAIVYL
jgi:hypothetical protein